KKVYENACQNDADGAAWERGLDDEEKNQIKKAKTPDQKVKCISKLRGGGTISTQDVQLVNHSPGEMDKFHQLYIDIETATNLTNLRSIDIEVYDQEQVPNLGKWDRMKVRKDNKELALFETAFEGAGAGPSGLDNEQIKK
ncbi:14254_t:CDS:2, partial [Cetraspora pellucida]